MDDLGYKTEKRYTEADMNRLRNQLGSERDRLKAEVERLEKSHASVSGQWEEMRAKLQDALLQNKEQARLMVDAAKWLRVVGPKHPDCLELAAKLEGVASQTSSETRQSPRDVAADHGLTVKPPPNSQSNLDVLTGKGFPPDDPSDSSTVTPAPRSSVIACLKNLVENSEAPLDAMEKCGCEGGGKCDYHKAVDWAHSVLLAEKH